MTLRTRLVVALGVLLLAGLVTFGVVTTSLYRKVQIDQLDEDLRASEGSAIDALRDDAEFPGAPEDRDAPDGGSKPDGGFDKKRPAPEVISTPGAYYELRDRSGRVLATDQVAGGTGLPALPAEIPMAGTEFRTVAGAEGDGDWRVMITDTRYPVGYRLLLAVPIGYLDGDRNQLLLIEGASGAALLLLLAGGSWLILRRGLQPLERMAGAAHRISEGDLSERVLPADGRSEVGQLGQALNNMLDQIELSFRRQEATEARLRQFLSDASHELRTPLTSIQGFAELFRLGADSDHVNLPIIMRRIEEESIRMRGLVEDLLLLARLDERREPLVGPVDLGVLAADACSDAVAAEPQRPVALHAAGSIVVQGDRDHLRQAIANLVSNALRHTPAGTTIEVSAARGAEDGRDVARVTVRDHGPGLDEVALAHVFDRFWQADAARVGRGAGLGLSIVAAIADEHGGRVGAANHPEGGAIFTLVLPASDSSSGQPAAPPAEHAAATAPGAGG